jgi:hypothetical protein
LQINNYIILYTAHKYKISARKPKGKGSLGRTRRRWNYTINIVLKETLVEWGKVLDSG